MKRVRLICRRCGSETRIEVLTREDIERDPERPRYRPTCPQCGNPDVEIRE